MSIMAQNYMLDQPDILHNQQNIWSPKNAILAKHEVFVQTWTFLVPLAVFIELEGHMIAQNYAVKR